MRRRRAEPVGGDRAALAERHVEQLFGQLRGSDGQVAGYFETFATGNPTQNFTFLTVKGAGHMVPKDRPRHAPDMLARFLEGGEYAKVEKAAEAPLCAR